jgi:long-chain acyl-CoA synthetase
VHAAVTPEEPEDAGEMTVRLRGFCVERLARYKVPVRFEVVAGSAQHSERYKKLRAGGQAGEASV